MINSIKNLIITALSILALYLTVQLWFEEISNRNFFYTFSEYLNINSKNTSNINNIGIKPYRIVTSLSNNQFYLSYNNSNNSIQRELSDEIIKKTLDIGTFIKTGNFLDTNVICCLYYSYEFPFEIDADIFSESFGIFKNKISSNIKTFDTVILLLDESNKNIIRTFFANTYNGSYAEYQIKDSELANNFNTSFSEIKNAQNKMFFNAVSYDRDNVLTTNIYIPNSLNNIPLFSSIVYENNYASNGQIDFQSAGQNLEIFLNPATLNQPSRLNGSYTFSDKSSVVRYYSTNVIEYSNYSPGTKKTKKNILNDYYSALKFIQKDHMVTNEYYLTNYHEDGETTIFYFDYVINNMPLILSEELKHVIDLNHMIEITVEHENIIKYKKLAYKFLTDSHNYETNNINSVNELLQNKNIQKAMLTYKLKNLYDIELDWHINYFNKSS